MLQREIKTYFFVVITDSWADSAGVRPNKRAENSPLKLLHVGGEVNVDSPGDIHDHFEVYHRVGVKCELQLPVLHRRN